MFGEGEKREEIETVINPPLLVIKVLSFSLIFFFQFYIPSCQIKQMTGEKSQLCGLVHRQVTYFKNLNIL